MTATQAAPGSLPLPPLVIRPDLAARRDLHRPDERSALAVQHLLALLVHQPVHRLAVPVDEVLPQRQPPPERLTLGVGEHRPAGDPGAGRQGSGSCGTNRPMPDRPPAAARWVALAAPTS